MKIPSSFKLLGNEVRVTIIEQADWKVPDAVGFYDSKVSQMAILRTTTGLMEHTFYHELMHAILTAMGRDKLSQDEAFVDLTSGLLMQALNSASGVALKARRPANI